MNIDAVAERLAGIISDKQDKAGCALACSTLEVVIADALRKETEEEQFTHCCVLKQETGNIHESDCPGLFGFAEGR